MDIIYVVHVLEIESMFRGDEADFAVVDGEQASEDSESEVEETDIEDGEVQVFGHGADRTSDLHGDDEWEDEQVIDKGGVTDYLGTDKEAAAIDKTVVPKKLGIGPNDSFNE